LAIEEAKDGFVLDSSVTMAWRAPKRRANLAYPGITLEDLAV
jgi:hypothetical protein